MKFGSKFRQLEIEWICAQKKTLPTKRGRVATPWYPSFPIEGFKKVKLGHAERVSVTLAINLPHKIVGKGYS